MLSEYIAQLHTPALSLSYEVFILCRTEDGRKIRLVRMRVLRCDIVTACGASCRDSLAFCPKKRNFVLMETKRDPGLVPVG
jgi:hypothetical protein